jgi:hypothetical protein
MGTIPQEQAPTIQPQKLFFGQERTKNEKGALKSGASAGENISMFLSKRKPKRMVIGLKFGDFE